MGRRSPRPGARRRGSPRRPAGTAAVTPTQTAPTTTRDERRREPAHVETLERVDVPDHAREQVPAAIALELGRRERLDPLVEAPADPTERAQREVVRDEPIEITAERPGEPEEANGDDRHREGQDRRLLGGSRDQVAGRRQQGDAEADGERAERARRARRATAGTSASVTRRPSVRIRRPSTLASTIRPAASVTTRSARRASSGRWAMRRTVRPSRSRSTASTDELGAFGVEIRRRLVENHERSVAEERACQRDPLELAGRERASAVADEGLVAVRQLADERVGAGQGGRRSYVARRRPRRCRAGCSRRPCRGTASAAAAPRRPAPARRQRRTPRGRPLRPVMLPSMGSTRRRRSEAIVLLPLPLGPTSATVSPGASSRSIESSTTPCRVG